MGAKIRNRHVRRNLAGPSEYVIAEAWVEIIYAWEVDFTVCGTKPGACPTVAGEAIGRAEFFVPKSWTQLAPVSMNTERLGLVGPNRFQILPGK